MVRCGASASFVGVAFVLKFETNCVDESMKALQVLARSQKSSILAEKPRKNPLPQLHLFLRYKTV